ncbi:MAG: DUF4179 domain-containing protein [Chloroflexota bacterium]|nr:DUF4179 domain-containing protein [Chloroflexota bacterium]
MSETLEQRLETILTPGLPVELRAGIDTRVAAAVADAAPHTGPRPTVRLRRILAVGIAAVLIVGAVGAGYDAFQRIIGSGGWQTAWERAEFIGQSATANGHEVILQRAYADAGQVVVGVSIPTIPDAMNFSGLSVTDEFGQEYWPTGGTGTNEVDGSVLVYAFLPTGAIPAGERQFEVTLQANGMSEAWQFSFPLTVHAAVTVPLELSSTASDITFHLGDVIVSPTVIRMQVAVDEPSTPTDQSWAPAMASLRHDGAEIPLNGSPPEMISTRGVDDPSGHWEFVVTELVGGEIDGEQVRRQGPWTFAFDVP